VTIGKLRGSFLLAFVVSAVPAFAQSGPDLNVSPKRVVLNAADRIATVFVYNRGTGEATYRVELVDRVMTPDGQIRAVTEAAKDPAAAPSIARVQSSMAMLTYTPRRVTLTSSQSQTVRLRVLRPPALANGEYRTFLTVTALPSEDAGLTADQAGVAAAGDRQINFKIVPLFSISIPVLVRQGPVDARAGIKDARLVLETGKPAVACNLARLGTSSLYGTVEVHRGSEKGEMIGAVSGLGVYTEVDHRPIVVPLTKPPVHGERLTVLFRDDDSRAGAVLASETLTVP
jgi:hypothetical protein